MHRDIKDSNIIISDDYNLKYIDFAFSLTEKEFNNEFYSYVCGTLEY